MTNSAYYIGGGAPKEEAPAPKPKAKAKPKPKPKAKQPKPVKNTSFQDEAKKLMDAVNKKLDSLKIEQPKAPTIDLSGFEKQIADLEAKVNTKPKVYNTGSVGVQAAPLQINAAAPTPQTSGVDSFKRRKSSYTPAKTLTANALNI